MDCVIAGHCMHYGWWGLPRIWSQDLEFVYSLNYAFISIWYLSWFNSGWILACSLLMLCACPSYRGAWQERLKNEATFTDIHEQFSKFFSWILQECWLPPSSHPSTKGRFSCFTAQSKGCSKASLGDGSSPKVVLLLLWCKVGWKVGSCSSASATPLHSLGMTWEARLQGKLQRGPLPDHIVPAWGEGRVL